MKKRNWLLLLLAVALVLCASVGAASAYFTATASSRGGYVIHIKPDPHIDEEVTDHKEVTITNDEDASPVFVRAKAFTGAEYEDLLEYEGTNWNKGAEGFYYYAKALNPGESTEKLNIKISMVLPEGAEIGEQANVIVAYESAPAIYKANGEPDFETAWGLNA